MAKHFKHAAAAMAQLSVRLPREHRDALAHAARVNGRDIADEVRDAVQSRIDSLRNDPDFLERSRETIERERAAFLGDPSPPEG